MPQISGKMIELIGDAGYLLIARLLNCMTWCVGIALIYATTQNHLYASTLGRALTVSYSVNPTMLRITHEASNYALPATLSLGQVLLIAANQADALPSRVFIRAALVGLVGGLAVGVKLYYLPVVALFILLSGFVHRESFSVAAFVWAIMGFGFVLLPPIALNYFFPFQFIFNNHGFHRRTTAAYREFGNRAPMGMLQKRITFAPAY